MKQSLHGSLYGLSMDPPVNIPKEAGSGEIGILHGSDAYHTSSDATLFSSLLPAELPHEKVNLNVTKSVRQSVDNVSCGLNKYQKGVDINDSLEDVEAHAIGSLLPDDEDELLAGIMDDLEPSLLEDLEDYDLFGFGGMELETDLQESLSLGMSKVNLSDGAIGNGMLNYGVSNGVGSVAGEHPYGEHPSRTLFVRNINSNVEDSELRALFEQYGDIRTLYTACKHRGFVMISYYDIRAARTAMRALQHRALRRRKLDIHFSIPKDNPSDKDINQGTLVVFNLDLSVSNDDLRQIFGAYGEVKEIRETPNKRHHKFIEFYDVRAAEAALKLLNRSDIAGKRIKLEPSRPGGARRNLMLQLNQDLEQDEPRSFQHQIGSPITNSPPGSWAQFNSPIEHGPLQTISKSPFFRTMSPTTSNHLPGLASLLHSQLSSSAKVASLGNDLGRGSRTEHAFSNPNSVHGVAFHQSHSLPDPKVSQFRGTMSPLGPSNGSGMETISGPQFIRGSPNNYSEHNISSAWAAPSLGHPYSSNDKGHGYVPSGRNGPFLPSSQLHYQPHHHHHHVGSAPSVVPLERHSGFFPKSPETSFIGPVEFGGMSLGHGDGSFMMHMGVRPPMNSGISALRNTSENASSLRMMSSPRLSPVFLGNGLYPGVAPTGMEGFTDRGRSRRVESNGNGVDNKKQFQLELDKIISGEDTRTTLMIKNIPNKYTSKMLLAAIDENHKGTYDFLYLPIDFKNKCNVGYAFINMLSPKDIISFYEAFNGKKWEKFNSEKVASLAYARIQGKAALISHFQNSSLMNEDKRCRPILFDSGATEAGEQGLLASNNMSIQVRRQEESYFGDFSESPSKDGCGEKS